MEVGKGSVGVCSMIVQAGDAWATAVMAPGALVRLPIVVGVQSRPLVYIMAAGITRAYSNASNERHY